MICLDSPPLWTSEVKTSYTPSKIQCNLLGPDNQVGHSSPVLDISCKLQKKFKNYSAMSKTVPQHKTCLN